MSSSQVRIAEGKRIKVPSALLNRYYDEYKRANEILRQKRLSIKNNRNANNNYSLTLRKNDISRFTSRKAVMRYLKTTHEVITGEYFKKQTRLYKQNLLKSMLVNIGGFKSDTENIKISLSNIKVYERYFDDRDKALFRYIFYSDRHLIERLANSDKENLTRFLYGPEQYQDEHTERLEEILNNPSPLGVADYKGQYDDYLKYIGQEV